MRRSSGVVEDGLLGETLGEGVAQARCLLSSVVVVVHGERMKVCGISSKLASCLETPECLKENWWDCRNWLSY